MLQRYASNQTSSTGDPAAAPAFTLKEHDPVVLIQPMVHAGLAPGAMGVVVHVYPDAAAAPEVEFIDARGHTLSVLTVDRSALAPVPAAVPDAVPDAGAAYELDDGALTCRQIAALRRDVARHFSRGGIMQTSSLFDPPEKPKTEEGSSNVYADLNYLDPQGMQRKSTLAFAIAREIRRRETVFRESRCCAGR